jgi:hypothetical protein
VSLKVEPVEKAKISPIVHTNLFEKQILQGTFEYPLNQINNLKKSKLTGKLIFCQRAFSTGSSESKNYLLILHKLMCNIMCDY